MALPDAHKAEAQKAAALSNNEAQKQAVSAAAAAARENRQKAARAAAALTYATGPLAGELVALDFKDLAVKDGRTLDEASANMAQRKALTSANVDLIYAWSKTGVKPETVVRLVNTLLLIWIGVNTQ